MKYLGRYSRFSYEQNNLSVADTFFSFCHNFIFKFFVMFSALLPTMVLRKSGHIVAVSSVQGRIAIPYRYSLIQIILNSHRINLTKCPLSFDKSLK